VTFLIAQSTGLAGLFTALGLNVQAFVLDLIAFLVTCYVVGRWVLPPMAKALDAKREELEAAARQEAAAKTALEKAEATAAEVIAKARSAADEVLAAARTDAVAQLDDARAKAEAQTDRMISEAREQLSRDVSAARRELRSEAAKLVAKATATVLDEKIDEQRDRAIIGRSLGVD
jgi:F-type H+-transporting ATPase subunit b